MSLTLRSFPSSSERRTISSLASSIELLLPLKSKRWASSFCACWTALATSCMSVLETTSKENSCAMTPLRHPERSEGPQNATPSPSSRLRMTCSLLLHHLNARWYREPEQLRRRGPLVKAGERERRLIAFAVGVRHAANRMRWRVNRHDHVADHGRAALRLQRRGHGVPARRLLRHEGAIARGGVADDQERQLGAALRVEVRHRDLLVGGDVEP